MKRLIKFFKGLGGKELNEVHEEHKTSHPLGYLFRVLNATKEDIEITLKLEELLSQEKIKIVCKSDGMPFNIKVAAIICYMEIKNITLRLKWVANLLEYAFLQVHRRTLGLD